ncbi:MAG TPA: hypothetical protein VGO91_10050 [Pyrinomonadaceae bacterium]|jgi:hypothetical protein|nr:hypothetical protein [Pyrinomonadaceae bacterium]
MLAVHVEETVYRNAAEVLALIRDFKFCTLPRQQWTHRAHLTVALWHQLRYPWPEAVKLMREGIKRYNDAHGIVQTRESGYHETMTLFWMRLVREYLKGAASGQRCSLASLANELVARHPKNLPLVYYSRERLMSWEAREHWVSPDLLPLATGED